MCKDGSKQIVKKKKKCKGSAWIVEMAVANERSVRREGGVRPDCA